MQGGEACCASKNEHQKAGSKRIKCAAMTYPRLTCNATHLRHHIVARWAIRLVNEKNAVNARGTWTSTCHC
jgi:hypothetical protein